MVANAFKKANQPMCYSSALRLFTWMKPKSVKTSIHWLIHSNRTGEDSLSRLEMKTKKMLRCLQMSDYYCVKLQAWSNCQKNNIFCCCCCHINNKGAAEWATLTYVTYVTLKNSPKSCFIYCSLVFFFFFYHLPLRVIHTHLTTGVTYLSQHIILITGQTPRSIRVKCHACVTTYGIHRQRQWKKILRNVF